MININHSSLCIAVLKEIDRQLPEIKIPAKEVLVIMSAVDTIVTLCNTKPSTLPTVKPRDYGIRK